MELDEISGLLEYQNIPPLLGGLVSSGKATLHELDTIYSVEDAYLMIEVLMVDAHNRRLTDEYHRRKAASER